MSNFFQWDLFPPFKVVRDPPTSPQHYSFFLGTNTPFFPSEGSAGGFLKPILSLMGRKSTLPLVVSLFFRGPRRFFSSQFLRGILSSFFLDRGLSRFLICVAFLFGGYPLPFWTWQFPPFTTKPSSSHCMAMFLGFFLFLSGITFLPLPVVTDSSFFSRFRIFLRQELPCSPPKCTGDPSFFFCKSGMAPRRRPVAHFFSASPQRHQFAPPKSSSSLPFTMLDTPPLPPRFSLRASFLVSDPTQKPPGQDLPPSSLRGITPRRLLLCRIGPGLQPGLPDNFFPPWEGGPPE